MTDPNTPPPPRNRKGTIMIAKEECLTCTHLVGDLGTSDMNCWDGPFCPAQGYAIEIGVDVASYAIDMATALNDDDSEEFARLMSDLDTMSATVRRNVLARMTVELQEGSSPDG